MARKARLERWAGSCVRGPREAGRSYSGVRPRGVARKSPPAGSAINRRLHMPFELRVALRYLTARRKQAFISLISGISVLGVAVGVMALLIALGLMTGLQGEIRTRILGATAHVSVFRSGNVPLEEYPEVLERLPGVVRSNSMLVLRTVKKTTALAV